MINIFTFLRDLRADLDTLWQAVAEMQDEREPRIGFDIELEEEWETVAPPEFEVTDLPLEDEMWIEG